MTEYSVSEKGCLHGMRAGGQVSVDSSLSTGQFTARLGLHATHSWPRNYHLSPLEIPPWFRNLSTYLSLQSFQRTRKGFLLNKIPMISFTYGVHFDTYNKILLDINNIIFLRETEPEFSYGLVSIHTAIMLTLCTH